jgi:integrase
VPKNLTTRGGIYYARIQINGRDTWKSLRTSDRREANTALRSLQRQAEQARAGIVPEAAEQLPTWEQAVERWGSQKLQDKKESTQLRYQVSLKQLSPYLAPLAVRQVDQACLNDYVTARMGLGTSAATVRRDLTVVSQVWKVAKRAGWVTGENPALAELEEIDEVRDPARPVRMRDLARVLRSMTPRMAALNRFIARTGCRQEEAASLEWSEVDLRSTPATVAFVDTKTRNPRVVEMSMRATALLRGLLRSKRTDFVFWHGSPEDPSRYQNVSSNFSHHVRAVAAAAEAGRFSFRSFRCHDLRHTYAIRWLLAGGDIYRLSRDLGHSAVDVTDQVYGGWIRQQDRQAPRHHAVAKPVAAAEAVARRRVA